MDAVRRELRVTCAVTVLVDDTAARSVVAVGSRAAANARAAAHGSAREALQVLSLLRAVSDAHPPLADPRAVVGEADRARWWVSRPALASARAWLDRCPVVSAGSLAGPGDEPPRVDAGLAVIAGGLRSSWLRPIVCDLTPRLPAAARALGWNAVKAVVLGHQPLRMDERATATWAHARLEAWATRTGAAIPDDLGTVAPHPLI